MMRLSTLCMAAVLAAGIFVVSGRTLAGSQPTITKLTITADGNNYYWITGAVSDSSPEGTMILFSGPGVDSATAVVDSKGNFSAYAWNDAGGSITAVNTDWDGKVSDKVSANYP